MLHDLPNELLIKIFEFDPTHRPKYKTCLQSINLIGLYPRFINFLNDVDEYVHCVVEGNPGLIRRAKSGKTVVFPIRNPVFLPIRGASR